MGVGRRRVLQVGCQRRHVLSSAVRWRHVAGRAASACQLAGTRPDPPRRRAPAATCRPPEEIAERSEGLRTWTADKVFLETEGDFSYRTVRLPGARLRLPGARSHARQHVVRSTWCAGCLQRRPWRPYRPCVVQSTCRPGGVMPGRAVRAGEHALRKSTLPGEHSGPVAARHRALQGTDLSEPDKRQEVSLSQQQQAAMDAAVDALAGLL